MQGLLLCLSEDVSGVLCCNIYMKAKIPVLARAISDKNTSCVKSASGYKKKRLAGGLTS